MNYDNDVKETQRRWKVRSPTPPDSLDLRLDLNAGDQLVFEGTATSGTITRRRSGQVDMQWGFNCRFTDNGGDSGGVQGYHLAANGPAIDISFFRNGTTRKMEYSGTVTFPAPLGEELRTTGTWMADEGP